jgi:uncharacterized protein (DUF2267 family)
MTMLDCGGFIRTVSERADASLENADRAAGATLRAPGERLTAGERDDIGERLPAELRACLEGAGDLEPFDADEFLRRVAERADLDRSHAAGLDTARSRPIEQVDARTPVGNPAPAATRAGRLETVPGAEARG